MTLTSKKTTFVLERNNKFENFGENQQNFRICCFWFFQQKKFAKILETSSESYSPSFWTNRKTLKYCMSKKRDFQDLPRWCSKTELKIFAGFGFKQSWDLPDVQYYCGILFRYQKKYPESLEYMRPPNTLYGLPLFQKQPKILAKISKKCGPTWACMLHILCHMDANHAKIVWDIFYTPILTSCNRGTRRNVFRPN